MKKNLVNEYGSLERLIVHCPSIEVMFMTPKNLNPEDKDIGRRIVDFFSGLAYGTDGSFEKAAEGIYLLVPAGMSGTTSLMSDE